ncbi:MAG: hypothetical protein PHD13_00755 [Methanocellales archaeon]|nr:hypothetical protein [Methanocellales archaeon]MDD3291414.1 hypothetical protein [Methanocellales archaeon]MDD5234696.1 hypothetical protein [Methanocellales archaeon]MDD5484953.1 hypothetical protein [Methanocellales archaeon]
MLKDKTPTKKVVWAKRFVWAIILIVITNIFTEVTDIVIVQPITDPIKNFFNPPKVSLKIDPLPYPMSAPNGNYIIRVNVKNNGTKTLENIMIDYKMEGIINETKRTHLQHKTFLDPGDEDYFEFEVTGLNPNCSIRADAFTLEFYKDKTGQRYVKIINFSSDICMYRNLQINITAKDFSLPYTYPYPYSEGNIKAIISGIGGDIRLYEEAQDKSELVCFYRGTGFLLDIETACLRGDLDPELCQEYLER